MPQNISQTLSLLSLVSVQMCRELLRGVRPCGELALGLPLPAPGKGDLNGESGGLGVQLSEVRLQSCQQVPLCFLDFSWPVSLQVKWGKGTVVLPLFQNSGKAGRMTVQGSETVGNVCVLYSTATQQNKCVVSKTFGGAMPGCALRVTFGPLTSVLFPFLH